MGNTNTNANFILWKYKQSMRRDKGQWEAVNSAYICFCPKVYLVVVAFVFLLVFVFVFVLVFVFVFIFVFAFAFYLYLYL